MATWKSFKGWNIRVRSALRCLRYKYFVLVAWSRCPDGDLNFQITHKGVELPEAVHRCRVDAAEILQDACDQESAIISVSGILG